MQQNLKRVIEGVEESELRLMTKSEMKNLQPLVCFDNLLINSPTCIYMSGYSNTVTDPS